MDYKEAQDYKPTKQEIDKEIRKHGADPEEFFAECKGKPTAKKMFDWLGY